MCRILILFLKGLLTARDHEVFFEWKVGCRIVCAFVCFQIFLVLDNNKEFWKKLMVFALFKRWPPFCSYLPCLQERLGECPLMLRSLEIKTKLTVGRSIVLHITTNKWGEICLNGYQHFMVSRFNVSLEVFLRSGSSGTPSRFFPRLSFVIFLLILCMIQIIFFRGGKLYHVRWGWWELVPGLLTLYQKCVFDSTGVSVVPIML